MVRKLCVVSTVTAACAAFLAFSSTADSAPNKSTALTFKPVSSVESLMHGQRTFFKRITKELAEPSSEHRNEEIHEAAEVLAELANVNRFNAKDRADYRAWATQLRDIALDMAKETKKKTDVDDAKLNAFLGRLKATCGQCHDMYQ